MSTLEESYTLHRHDLASDPDALVREVGARIEAVVTTGNKGLKRGLIERLPNLRFVASSGVGYDSIDIAACTERGIVVANTPDVLTNDVADIGLALILATALIEALKTGGIAGAGLDVFANEPGPNADLIAMENVELYPHHASGTVETRDAMAQLVVDNLAALFAGRSPLTPVNLPAVKAAY